MLQGSLDLMILRTLDKMGTGQTYGIASQLEQTSGDQLNLNPGTIYAALIGLEQHGWTRASWGRTENSREAKYYAITKRDEERERWRQMPGVIERLLAEEQSSCRV